MSSEPEPWLAWCDGTALPNPGRIGLGGVLIAPDGQCHQLSEAGATRGCNNEAEALAMLAVLQRAQALGVQHLVLHSDSDVVVRLAQDEHSREAARLAPLFARLRQTIQGFAGLQIRWLPQHRNQQADALARAALGLPPRVVKAVRRR